MKRTPNADVYALKREHLGQLEALSAQGQIDLWYGDESRVSLLPCVPYGWQSKYERVAMPSERGGDVNCFALVSRDGDCQAHLAGGRITAEWISERLDAVSLSLRRLTVVVLDNARVHTKAAREQAAVWQERGLFVWFLPAYSPPLRAAVRQSADQSWRQDLLHDCQQTFR